MEPRKDYVITLQGCVDDTRMEMRLTNSEYELIKRLGLLSEEESRSCCMPTLVIEKKEPDKNEEE